MGEEAGDVHGGDVSGVGVLGGHALDAAALEVEPNAAHVAHAADVVEGVSFAAEGGADFPVVPAVVVFLGGEHHGGVGTGAVELVVAPVGCEQPGDAGVVNLKHQQQALFVVTHYHHGPVLLCVWCGIWWVSHTLEG